MYIQTMPKGIARDKSEGDIPGFNLKLAQPVRGMLEDFCAAFYRGEKTEVIHRALAHYIRWRLAKTDADEEREIYERLQAARQKPT